MILILQQHSIQRIQKVEIKYNVSLSFNNHAISVEQKNIKLNIKPINASATIIFTVKPFFKIIYWLAAGISRHAMQNNMKSFWCGNKSNFNGHQIIRGESYSSISKSIAQHYENIYSMNFDGWYINGTQMKKFIPFQLLMMKWCKNYINLVDTS